MLQDASEKPVYRPTLFYCAPSRLFPEAKHFNTGYLHRLILLVTESFILLLSAKFVGSIVCGKIDSLNNLVFLRRILPCKPDGQASLLASAIVLCNDEAVMAGKKILVSMVTRYQ